MTSLENLLKIDDNFSFVITSFILTTLGRNLIVTGGTSRVKTAVQFIKQISIPNVAFMARLSVCR